MVTVLIYHRSKRRRIKKSHLYCYVLKEKAPRDRGFFISTLVKRENSTLASVLLFLAGLSRRLAACFHSLLN